MEFQRFKVDDLLIREPKFTDARLLVDMLNDYDVAKNSALPGYPYDEKRCLVALERYLNKDRQFMFWDEFVIDKEGIAIGQITLKGDRLFLTNGMLSYHIDKEHRRQGNMEKSLKAIIPYALTMYQCLCAYVMKDNEPSRTLLEKLGFQWRGYGKGAINTFGRLQDYDYFGVTAEEYGLSDIK
jgi:RimJ/RimL family protein N-acetyltransferase